MKAVVIETHKDYCILLTRDGRFIRKRMVGSSVEIGEEVVVSQPSRLQRNRRVFRLALAAASVFIVLSLTAAFSIDYIRSFFAPDLVTMAAAPETAQEDIAMSAPAQAEAFDGGAGRAQDLDKQAPSASFSIQEGPVEYFLDDFKILYEAISDQERSLSLRIENTGTSVFTGMMEISFHADEVFSKTVILEFRDFSEGQYRQELIPIAEDEKSFTLSVYGVFSVKNQ